jgi:hypothetical protein
MVRERSSAAAPEEQRVTQPRAHELHLHALHLALVRGQRQVEVPRVHGLAQRHVRVLRDHRRPGGRQRARRVSGSGRLARLFTARPVAPRGCPPSTLARARSLARPIHSIQRVTQRALSVTQRALSVTQRDIALTLASGRPAAYAGCQRCRFTADTSNPHASLVRISTICTPPQPAHVGEWRPRRASEHPLGLSGHLYDMRFVA